MDESPGAARQRPQTMRSVWEVGALCRAIADSLAARFNPVAVQGEISGFTRASSGHCYFQIKDSQGQLRCAMFRRAAQGLLALPQEGDRVEVEGRLALYEPRGELQLVVETLRRAGQGALFEQFLRLKAQLEAQGFFAAERKRPLLARPRGIGVVTSRNAAAWHDVMTALQRRVPHIPVVLANALVQGAEAPASLCRALKSLGQRPELDVILLVRGGGSIEDLWAFNDAQLAQAIVASPLPVVTGVGHETDFTIADFCADLRAPTPTAAAELCATPRQESLLALTHLARGLADGVQRWQEREAVRLDQLHSQLARPRRGLEAARLRLHRLAQRQAAVVQQIVSGQQRALDRLTLRRAQTLTREPQRADEQLARLALRLEAQNPRRVLERGYAWLADAQGQPLGEVERLQPGDPVVATLASGMVDLTVRGTRQP